MPFVLFWRDVKQRSSVQNFMGTHPLCNVKSFFLPAYKSWCVAWTSSPKKRTGKMKPVTKFTTVCEHQHRLICLMGFTSDLRYTRLFADNPVLLVEETGVPRETCPSNWQPSYTRPKNPMANFICPELDNIDWRARCVRKTQMPPTHTSMCKKCCSFWPQVQVLYPTLPDP